MGPGGRAQEGVGFEGAAVAEPGGRRGGALAGKARAVTGVGAGDQPYADACRTPAFRQPLGGGQGRPHRVVATGDQQEIGPLWVGVRCDSTVAAGREIARGDRVQGMAEAQADIVHEGVHYDLEVDTTHTESLTCARTIAAHVG
ncbi:phosphotransferase-like protein [Streptomyces europaeiscabiei]|uniref:phosphotransferase-like protein n=1 Tax=Streptomyces europaeiscabiei TaxID=146819 RepID=UPI0038F79476